MVKGDTPAWIRWASGAAVYVVGLVVAGRLVGSRPLAAGAQVVVDATPGTVATAAIETFGQSAQPLVTAGVALALIAAAAAVPRTRLWLHEQSGVETDSVGDSSESDRGDSAIPAESDSAISVESDSPALAGTLTRRGTVAVVVCTLAVFLFAGAGPVRAVLATGVATLPPLAGRWLLVTRRGSDRRAFLRRATATGVALVGFGGGAFALGRLGDAGGGSGPRPGQSFATATETAAEGGTGSNTGSGTTDDSGRAGEPGETDPNAQSGDQTPSATAARPKTATGRTEPDGSTVTPGATETGEEMSDAAARSVPVTVTTRDTEAAFDFAFEGMPPQLTPVADHYVVDKQLDDPELSADDWALTVGTGDATTETVTYSLTDLIGHDASTRRVVTLACISNPVAGPLISTMRWRGIPLSTLLSEAGVTDDAVDVVTRAADGYEEAIPWEIVRDRPGIVLAYGANGQTLPREHGFPARLLVPGRYGMKMTKWVTELGAVEREFDGYWQTRGWDEEAPVQTLSAIRAAQRRGDRIGLGGIAFAGSRDIQRVEVSLDGGESWHDATLEAPPSPLARRRWRYVTERSPGTFEAVVRATDGTGTVQTERRSTPHPDGATGWHRTEFEL
jgi:DMSO/TMAO reductase YedYZ molybdopterin-dependent catalytic subunit